MQFRRLMTAYCWKKWNGQLTIWKNGKSLGTDSVTVELLETGEKWPGKSKRFVHTYGSVKHGLQNGPRQYWQYCDHFKERWSHAVNYSRPTITLMNIMSKVMMMILLERLQHSVEPFLTEEQAGFESNRSTVQYTDTQAGWLQRKQSGKTNASTAVS